MQDRYPLDIGDFAKFTLLCALGGSTLRLGVVWYLNPDEEGNRDGEFVRYPELRECNEGLYDKMQLLLSSGTRQVAVIEQAGVLPANTSYFRRPLSFRDIPPSDVGARRRRREQWLQGAMEATLDADIVFLDPDNGFAPSSASDTANGAQKYVFLKEILAFLNRNQSVVVYHHHARNESLPDQVERHLQLLQALGAPHLWALTFHRKSVRAFFVVAATQHSTQLQDRTLEFLTTLWGYRGHFQLHTSDAERRRTVVGQSARSSASWGTRSAPGPLKDEICEIWEGQRWKPVGVDEALEIRRRRDRWPGGRCVECHRPVRPHKLGTTGQRAHFEHLDRNPDCSRSDR